MKITLDFDARENVEAFRKWLDGMGCKAAFPDVIEGIDADLESDAERSYGRAQEMAMESGGADDSKYRRDMIDAGRGHLVR